MPAMVSACSRIHVQQVALGIAHDTQNMGMTRDEKRGLGGGNLALRVGRVMTGITAHVRHIDLHTGTAPVKILAKRVADLRSVDIAVHTTDGLEPLQRAEDSWSEVTGVPDFVTLSEIAEDCLVKKTVRVGHET